MDIRKKLGLLFAGFSSIVIIANSLSLDAKSTYMESVINIVLPLVMSAILLSTCFIPKRIGEWVQVVIIGSLSIYIAIMGSSSQQFLSALLFVITLGMIYNYKLFHLTKNVMLVAISIIFMSFLLGCFFEGNPYRALNMLSIFLVFVAASYWLFAYEIKRLTIENAQMIEINSMNQSSAEITHLLKAKTSALQSLSDCDLSDAQYLALLKLTVDDVQDTVGKIMTYARSSVKDEMENINMKNIISSVCLMVENTPGVKNRVTFNTVINSDVPVRAIPLEMKGMIQNLIVNATEAISDKGEVRVIYSENQLTVEDTGSGIVFCNDCNKDDCLLCNRFMSGKTTKSTGNGLGISQIRNMCKENGYAFRIKSVVGKGTSIKITFA